MDRCPVFKPWQLGLMFRAINDGTERKREQGFELTEDNDPKKYCEGTRCSVHLSPEEKLVKGKAATRRHASFHTHPDGTIHPSVGDVLNALDREEEYFCIGGTHSYFNPVYGRLITCYVNNTGRPVGEELTQPGYSKIRATLGGYRLDEVADSTQYYALRDQALKDIYGLRCNYWQDGVEYSSAWDPETNRRKRL